MKTMLTILTVLALTIALSGCGKADIEASCTMNGWGSGKCEFLNNGTAEGSQDIEIHVLNVRTGLTAGRTTLKSGIVARGDVRSRQFLVDGVNDGCKADFSEGGTWMDVCSFFVTPVESN